MSESKSKKEKTEKKEEESSSGSSGSSDGAETENENEEEEVVHEEGEKDENKEDKENEPKEPEPPIQINREEYLILYKDLWQERSQLLMKNNMLHRRIGEYFKKRKMDHMLKQVEVPADMEEKYQQKLFAYEDLKMKQEMESNDIIAKIQKVRDEYNAQLKLARKKFNELQQHEKNTGQGLIYAKRGKPISEKAVDRFLTLQRRKTEQAAAMMLKYIRLRNAVTEQESIVKKLEKVGPSLYVHQYEEMRVEKLNYTNKIEERDDELIKNRAKCTEHNMILAHIREKMHHTSEIIDINECDLGDAEMEYQRAREDLTLIKTHRDKLRWSLEAEARKAGLLTRRDLLRDFQDSEDLVISLKKKAERLKARIASTGQQLREMRKSDKSGTTSSMTNKIGPPSPTTVMPEDLPEFTLF